MAATFELPGWTSEGVAIVVHWNRLMVTGESAVLDSFEDERSYVIRERRSETEVGSWSLSSLDIAMLMQRVRVKI